jgi:hypothetical protein
MSPYGVSELRTISRAAPDDLLMYDAGTNLPPRAHGEITRHTTPLHLIRPARFYHFTYVSPTDESQTSLRGYKAYFANPCLPASVCLLIVHI